MTETDRPLSIVAIGAHMDDTWLGMGGVALKAVRKGHRVTMVQVVSTYGAWPVVAGRQAEIEPILAKLAADAGVEFFTMGFDYMRLVNEPELVILDEPTSGLDPIGTREVKDLILELKAQGRTVLLCSHLMADIEEVCDRIAILHLGVLRQAGRVADLLAHRDERALRCRGLTDEAAALVAADVRARGGEVLSIDQPRASLEEVFLSVVRAKTPGREDGGEG